jgi:hypothetical protein
VRIEAGLNHDGISVLFRQLKLSFIPRRCTRLSHYGFGGYNQCSPYFNVHYRNYWFCDKPREVGKDRYVSYRIPCFLNLFFGKAQRRETFSESEGSSACGFARSIWNGFADHLKDSFSRGRSGLLRESCLRRKTRGRGSGDGWFSGKFIPSQWWYSFFPQEYCTFRTWNLHFSISDQLLVLCFNFVSFISESSLTL